MRPDVINGIVEESVRRLDEIERLRDLMIHAMIHSGYRNCGYNQMTTEQKAFYDEILETMGDDEMSDKGDSHDQ